MKGDFHAQPFVATLERVNDIHRAHILSIVHENIPEVLDVGCVDLPKKEADEWSSVAIRQLSIPRKEKLFSSRVACKEQAVRLVDGLDVVEAVSISRGVALSTLTQEVLQLLHDPRIDKLRQDHLETTEHASCLIWVMRHALMVAELCRALLGCC